VADHETIITLKLVDLAEKGDLGAIKYFFKLRGIDPDTVLKEREVVVREKELDATDASRETDTPKLFEVLSELQCLNKSAMAVHDGSGPKAELSDG